MTFRYGTAARNSPSGDLDKRTTVLGIIIGEDRDRKIGLLVLTC